ncbi:conserved virulence factor C family protein [Paenibacillus sp. J2TS4]|uniref:conserved virulence factor C family protein n=1 Tax=Paenibacillus sp. J2TS4 TaxID=2807194 RepID=UPI001B1D93F5|nr:conserved virulence factor C family protein [Paenibacillus sp. J2TS4]GIP34832.1 PBS lyase [Paenibacillus sp. J2TS4]
MRIISIEPTPSPNSMKINLDEKLPDGIRKEYTAADKSKAPEVLRQLLDIEGVTGLYHASDFLAIDRHPRGDWQRILAQAREIIGESDQAAASPLAEAVSADEAAPAYGEVKVLVQSFRGIPMQIRVSSGTEEQRAALPERFSQAAMTAGLASPNLIKERKLEEQGVRYGELKDVLEEIVREYDAAYDSERLQALIEQAVQQAPGDTVTEEAASLDELASAMNSEDWRIRYAALERIEPTEEAIPQLARVLDDPQMSIRRLATVYLGDIGGPEVMPLLFKALKDATVAVRRTAGDTLSDLGDPAAIGPMAEALQDRNKLVRWRAARFLYETGDDTALPALKAAKDDPEFEVSMQIHLAIERIEGGEAALGSVWQQMTNRSRE